MTNTTLAPSRWQVWIAYLPFADSPQKGKARPVVILDQLRNNTYMVLKITSQDIRNKYQAIKIQLDKELLDLKKESYIQLDPIFNIPAENLSDTYLGTLSRDLQTEIIHLLS